MESSAKVKAALATSQAPLPHLKQVHAKAEIKKRYSLQPHVGWAGDSLRKKFLRSSGNLASLRVAALMDTHVLCVFVKA